MNETQYRPLRYPSAEEIDASLPDGIYDEDSYRVGVRFGVDWLYTEIVPALLEAGDKICKAAGILEAEWEDSFYEDDDEEAESYKKDMQRSRPPFIKRMRAAAAGLMVYMRPDDGQSGADATDIDSLTDVECEWAWAIIDDEADRQEDFGQQDEAEKLRVVASKVRTVVHLIKDRGERLLRERDDARAQIDNIRTALGVRVGHALSTDEIVALARSAGVEGGVVEAFAAEKSRADAAEAERDSVIMARVKATVGWADVIVSTRGVYVEAQTVGDVLRAWYPQHAERLLAALGTSA